MRRVSLIFLVVLGIFFFWQAWLQRAVPEERSGKVLMGSLADFPPGSVKAFPKEKFIVFHDQDGIYVMSLRCPHKGCLVSFSKGDIGRCPCHGSLFSAEGVVERGPARKDLVWFFVGKDEEGRLYVDTGVIVPKGTKYQFN